MAGFQKSLFICSLLLIFGTPLAGQYHQERLQEIDILNYSLGFHLFDTSDTIRGEAGIQFKLKEDVEQLHLDLVSPQADGKGMNVRQVVYGDAMLPFRQAKDSLLIDLPAEMDTSEVYSLSISYEGIPADGLVISKNKYGARTFFGDNWPNRARHWFPAVDHPSDKATVEFIVTAPDHYQVVANGRQVEETNIDDNRKLTHWEEQVPLPTKVMVIGVAPFAVQYVDEVAGVPVTSWVFPQDRGPGFYEYAHGEYILDWFIRNVGAYPYEKLANVQSKTRYGGMENAGNIFYYENSVKGDRSSEALFAHEIAHQWFGNSASEANWHHIWLSEGFATYLTDLYMEANHGRDTFVDRMQEERATVLAFAGRKRAPVVDTTVTNLNQLLNANSYQKGAWVLHMLRREVGDDDFWEGLRLYYDRYKISNALTADFQAVMEEVSGKDLDRFFQQWLFTAGHPELDVNWSYDEEEEVLKLEVRQLQPEGPFRFPLDLLLEDSRNEKAQQMTLDIVERWHQYSFPLDFKPEKLILDPETWLLFEEEGSN